MGRLSGPLHDVSGEAGYDASHPPRMGFFTDTSVCIGCKACEVACKTWNEVPEDGYLLTGMSYDNTQQLGASTWRHVAFIEQSVAPPVASSVEPVETTRSVDPSVEPVETTTSVASSVEPVETTTSVASSVEPVETTPLVASSVEPVETTRSVGSAVVSTSSTDGSTDGSADGSVDLGMPGLRPDGQATAEGAGVRWLMSSDVCKHCTHAACLDVCPTGALFRTEFGTVVVQPDVCNGCGYCVPACPYGVIDLRPEDGRAFKCTLCYDRLKEGEQPACAQACPTESIQFGELDELRERADRRLEELHEKGVDVARLYGRDPEDGVGGDGAFFLLLDEPEVYGLPPDPVVTTRDLGSIWKHVGAAAVAVAGLGAASFFGRRR